MDRTYITDLQHFLDDQGEIPKSAPPQTRALASFLGLIVDQVTTQFPDSDRGVETEIRCHSPGCEGSIIGALDGYEEPVHWYCLDCGDNGTISNWQGSKWDNVGGFTPK